MASTRIGPLQVAGCLLALGGALMLAGYLLHADGETMEEYADVASQAKLSQYILAVGLLSLATGGLVGLSHRGPTTSTGLGALGAALVAVTGPVLMGAGAVAIAAADAAVAGDEAAYATFDFIGSVLFHAMPFFYLGLLLLALVEARGPSPRTPRWASWTAVAALAVGVVGQFWAIVAGEEGVAGLLAWVVPMLAFLWLVWLGVRVATIRSSAA